MSNEFNLLLRKMSHAFGSKAAAVSLLEQEYDDIMELLSMWHTMGLEERKEELNKYSNNLWMHTVDIVLDELQSFNYTSFDYFPQSKASFSVFVLDVERADMSNFKVRSLQEICIGGTKVAQYFFESTTPKNTNDYLALHKHVWLNALSAFNTTRACDIACTTTINPYKFTNAEADSFIKNSMALVNMFETEQQHTYTGHVLNLVQYVLATTEYPELVGQYVPTNVLHFVKQLAKQFPQYVYADTGGYVLKSDDRLKPYSPIIVKTGNKYTYADANSDLFQRSQVMDKLKAAR